MVSFEDGQSRTVDEIILCTGYKYSYPFLSEECGVTVQNAGRRVAPLYKHTFNIVHPSMAFLGIVYPVAAFLLSHMQIHVIISVLFGKTKLPAKQAMEKEEKELFIARLEQGYPPHQAHKLSSEFNFIGDFTVMAKLEPLSLHYQLMYYEVMQHRSVDLWNFRKYDYKVIITGNGEVTISKQLRQGETIV